MLSPNRLLLYWNFVRIRPYIFLLLPICLTTLRAPAQTSACTGAPLQVDKAVAAIHGRKNPFTDEEQSQLAHLLMREQQMGTLYLQAVVQVEVDTAGKVISTQPVSGPHELSSMLAHRLRRGSYIPFKEDGQPTCAQFIVRFTSRLRPMTGSEFPGQDKFHSLLKKCTDMFASGTSVADTLPVCQQTTDAGESLPASDFGRDKRIAYVITATALMRANRAKEALPYAEKAVETADLGFDDVSGKAAAYGVRGQARGLTGDLKGADEDLTKAEQLERATFEVPRKPEQKAFDTHALKSMLGFHAEVLTAMHKKAEADKLRDEAKKL